MKARVLIVDDSLTVRSELAEALGDYEVACAASGEEALAALAGGGVDAILLDLAMPGLSGLETCQRIKAEAAWRDLPVLILSAQSESQALRECINAGADDYVTKSEDTTVLKARLKAQLRQSRYEAEIVHLNNDLKAANADLESRIQERTAALEVHAEHLAKTNQELAAATAIKSEFLANMSHELRTPLNSVIGFSEVLFDETYGPVNDKQKSYIKNVVISGKHLLQLINQMLDVSKIEAGKMSLELAWVATPLLLRELAMLVAGLADKKGISLSLEIPDGLPTMQADELKFREIFYNLLSNAIKFTPAGGKIGMRASCTGPAVVVEVWDTGVGIAAENLDKVFRGFFRVDVPYTRLTEGTGLGLPLAKKLAELHGGSLSVESEGLNLGTLVRVTLPVMPTRPEALAPCSIELRD
jgi:signal transduction histidine kinase